MSYTLREQIEAVEAAIRAVGRTAGGKQQSGALHAARDSLNIVARCASSAGYVAINTTPGWQNAKVIDAVSGAPIHCVVEAHAEEGWVVISDGPGRPYRREQRAIRVEYAARA